MHLFVLILHVLGAAVLFGVVIIGLILIFSGTISKDKLAIFKSIRYLGPISAGWLLLTGLYLYFSEPENFRDSKLFWAKISLFVIDGLIATFLVERKLAQSEAQQDTKIITSGKVGLWIVVNLLILTSIITIGVILAN